MPATRARRARFFDKAHQIDEDIAHLVAAAGPTTTVVITSDHGSSDSGHHGSGELVARRSPLVIVGPHIVPGEVLEANQIDLAPTVAVLLGLPRPAPAEGRVLVEALQLDDAQRRALLSTELAEAQRYADAYAQANHVTPCKLADVRELPAWLDENRDVARIAPLAWGLALLLLCGYAVWQRDRARPTHTVLASLAPLLALELAALAWRLNHRWMEIRLGRIEHAVPVAAAVATGLLVVLCVLAGIAIVRRYADTTSPTALLVLFAFALLGDTLTPWGALVVGAIAMYTTRRAFALDALLVALFVGSRFLERMPSSHHVGALDVGVLVLVVYALVQRCNPLVLLAAVAVLLVHHLGSPVWPFRLLWMGALALVLASVRTRTPSSATAVVAALAMSLLAMSHEQDAPGIVLLAILAWRAGRSSPSPLRAALLVVALRIAFVSLFERGWSVSRLEVWLGYVANPGQSWLWGGAALVVKMWVPLALALVAVTARDRTLRRPTMLLVITAFVFRIAHALVWMTVARHTFYGPFVDVGFLLYLLIFVTLCAGLYLLASVRAPLPQSTIASP